MAEPVIKVALKGFDVRTAGDENLLYSSKWPVLNIYKSEPFTIKNPNDTQVIAEHDLNYPPLFWDFTNMRTRDDSAYFFSGQFKINEKQLVWTAPLVPVTGTVKGYYYIFTLNLTKDFTAPVINIGGTQGSLVSSRAFKIAKPGKSVHSKRLQDFVITTDARSPLVHRVAPGTVSNGEFVVEHDLTYIPLFLGYTKAGGYYSLIATGGGGGSQFSATSSRVRFAEATDGRELTVVVFKDPFEATRQGVVTV